MYLILRKAPFLYKTALKCSLLMLLPALILLFSPAFAEVNKLSNSKPSTDTVYTQVDTQPEFPGGILAFYKFVGSIVRYPPIDGQMGRQGTVIVSFIVESDGSLSDVKAVRGPSETLKKEAVRIVSASPKWQPGIKEARAVRTMYNVPIKFTTQTYNTQFDDNKIFSDPYRQAQFPGGFDALDAFISKNMQYPKEDQDKALAGKVIVSFVVEKDGALSHIKAVSGPSEAMKAEAIRLMKMSPKWKPGIMDDGMVARVSYNLPIEFVLPVSKP